MTLLTTDVANERKLDSGVTQHALCEELFLSTSAMGVSLSGIRTIVGALIAGLAGFLGFFSTECSVGSKTLNKKIIKHEKNVSIDKAPVIHQVVFKGD